jgi:type II secretory ATPase GspE/PulE/Tfp pilus assembly ATPase PilB-like protein
LLNVAEAAMSSPAGAASALEHQEPDEDEDDVVATQAVVVGLVSGEVLQGRVEEFLPFLASFRLDAVDDRAPGRRLEMSRVAWLGFCLEPGVDVPLPAWDSEGLDLEVAGGRRFMVAVAPGARENALGFAAAPISLNDPFRAMFFFREHLGAVASLALPAELLGPQPAPPTPAWTQPGEPAVSVLKGRVRLSELLLQRKLITDAQLVEARRRQAAVPGMVLGEALLAMAAVGEADLYRAIARRFELAFVDLDDIPISSEAVRAVDRKLLTQLGALPLDMDAAVCLVAVSDPRVDAPNALRFALKREVREVIATPSQIREHALRHWNGTAGTSSRKRAEFVVEDDRAVIKMVDAIIRDAATSQASDIHVEPQGDALATTVRFRVDGECYVYQEIPPQFWKAVVRRLKVMAELNITERRLPQDGKIRFELDEGVRLELRVATIPTQAGNEDVVMRLLAQAEPLPLDGMGLSADNLVRLREAITRPYGLILCVGPTGSGKTTTLHSALGFLNNSTRKIWTAEDPVEISQKGIRQVQVDSKVGFTFARAMRAFLRADPDVVMIGEMRDAEAAQIAVEASLTGHLVLSTLHTNSAPDTITRLLDMGLDPFTFADSLVAVLAQRLVRRMCRSCRTMQPASDADYAQLASLYGPEFEVDLGLAGPDGLLLPVAVGCGQCDHTGFRGRLALHELLITSPGVVSAIQERAPVSVVRERARADGMRTLLQDGVAKVVAGQTGIKQVVAQCCR